MNALKMKLDSGDTNLVMQKKLMEAAGRRCKTARKKLNSLGFDKEIKETNGLGRESNFTANLGEKAATTVDINIVKKKRGRRNYDDKIDDNKIVSKSDLIQGRLLSTLNEETKTKIAKILNDIQLLTDVEKLLLYLQLPTGSSSYQDPMKLKAQSNPLGKKADEEGSLAVTWIQSHLEEDPDVSLPKQEVYDEYQSYCEVTGNEPLCAADFGKVMKQIFPSVKPRRLGTRGNSRYCYSGLRKKVKISTPSLPDFQADKGGYKALTSDTDEILTASCHVLFEWAEKLLGTKFTSLKELASHLIEHMFVDNRSVAAFTLQISSSSQQPERKNVRVESKSKKNDTHVNLQRKIAEKGLIKEQRQKLQDQKSTSSDTKSLQTRRKGFRNKKMHLRSTQNGHLAKKTSVDKVLEPGTDLSKLLSTDMSIKSSDVKEFLELSPTVGSSSDDSEKSQQPQFTFQTSDSSLFKKKPSHQNSSNFLIVEDGQQKQKSKLSVSSCKSPICIPQSLPGFIIVPSIQQVQLSDAGGKPNTKCPPKYKRIQPKPLNEGTLSAMRCRTGSLGSALLKEVKPRSDGRRSSLALMQSDSSQESADDIVNISRQKLLKPVTNTSKFVKMLVPVKSEPLTDSSCERSSDQDFQHKEPFIDSQNKIVSKRGAAFNERDSFQELNGGRKFDLLLEDVTATKRHSDEVDFVTVTKKPHLEDFGSSDISSESLSPFSKDVTNINSHPSFMQGDNLGDLDLGNKTDGVSIHELETDALIDYFQGAATANVEISKDFDKVSQAAALAFCASQNRPSVSNSFSTVNKNLSIPEVNQLSQLRILLEQNLPHSTTKSPRLQPEISVSSKKSTVLMHTNDLSSQQAEVLGSMKSNLLSNSELSTIFLRNINPYLNHEEAPNNALNTNQTGAESLLSNDLVSADISDQDLLTVMDETSSFSKTSGTDAESVPTHISITNSDMQQLYAAVAIEHNTVQTQIPSVPPSPNTRRRAFNFMPISPRHTPIPEGMASSNATTCFSPVPTMHSHNTVSIGVGPSQPPSNSGSPFVSPRSTPVPPSRSRHSSGQSTYSTSRHTPFQSFDSGVSSISSSPFISPQPTPLPLSRFRHNSSHGPSKTVTFSTANNNQAVHTLSSGIGHGPLRMRHGSGSTGSYLGFSVLSPRSAPLSPLVNENTSNHFNFPPVSESRSRHSSGMTVTPLSPVSEQISPSSSTSTNISDLGISFENTFTANDPFINQNSGKEMIGVNSIFKQTRQRHASSSMIYSKPSAMADPLAKEVQLFLKNGSQNLITGNDMCNRSRSVPIHEMIQNLTNSLLPEDLKSYSAASNGKQGASFPMLVSTSVSSLPITSDSLMHCDKPLQPIQSDWSNLDGSNDMEISSARRNITGLLEGDDLQTTLEDLRDCDTDFSKFAQELELSQNEDVGL